MKCSTVLVCVLVGFVCGSDGFNILKKLKNIIHPTTSTTTERIVPIVPNFENESAENDSLSSESSEHQDWYVKSTTVRVPGVIYNEDKVNNFDTTSSSTTSSFLEESSHKFVKEEEPLTVTPPSFMDVYPTAPHDDMTSTAKYPVNYDTLTRTTESTFYEANETVQVNLPTASEKNYKQEDTFEDAIDCGTNANEREYDSPRNQNNEIKPGQQTPSRGCISGQNLKPQDISKQNNEDNQEGRIIFPDNPVLKPTLEPERSFDFNRYYPVSSTTVQILKDASVSSTTSRTKKAHVPVAVDDGRRIIDAPSKDCGPGKKVDENGRCRIVV